MFVYPIRYIIMVFDASQEEGTRIVTEFASAEKKTTKINKTEMISLLSIITLDIKLYRIYTSSK